MPSKSAAAKATPVATAPAPKKRVRRKSVKKAPSAPAGMWAWKTPNENAKLGWALGLLMLLMLGIACASGELRWHNGQLQAGLRSKDGNIRGYQWRWGERPRPWTLP